NAIEFLERQVESAIKKRNEYTGNDSDKITELNKEVNEAETKLLIVQGMIADTSNAVSAEVVNVFNALLSTLSSNVTPQIQNEALKILNALDFSGMEADELQNYTNQIAVYFSKLNDAFESGNKIEYDRISKELSTYTKNLETSEGVVSGLISTYNEMKQANDS